MKQKIKLVVDSCSSLSQKECDERGIECVQMTYSLGDENFNAFEVEENITDFYKKLDAVKSCSTGCVNESSFEECFEKLIKEGYYILYISLSAALSSTYDHAQIVAERINKKVGKNVIRTVDSRTGSVGIQILIDDAEELINQGKNLDEIEFILKDYAQKLESSFICRDLKFLHKCGRLSLIGASIGSLLKIVPIIQVDPTDSKLKVSEKCLGKKLAYKKLKLKITNLINSRPCQKCYIASCGLDEDVEEIKSYIIENTHIKNIKTGYIDKTMSCCCGPKTIAVFVR